MNPLDLVTAALEQNGCNPRGGKARCPAHEDRNPSLSYGAGRDEGVVLHCHAGCTTERIVELLGLSMSDLFPPKDDLAKPQIIAEYDYVDEAGKLLFQVCRRSDKQFPQRRPDGNGGWIWGLGDVRRVLYRLPKVREAVAFGESAIYVVEGEKDVHALERVGEVATCNPGGAKKWRPEYAEALAKAHEVIIIADNDEAGREHAISVQASLNGTKSKIVRAAKGKDAHDHLAAGLTVVDFVDLEDDPEPEASPPTENVREPTVVSWAEYRIRTPPETKWLVKGLLPASGFNVIGSTPKAGKTWLLALLAICCATGRTFLGRFAVVEPVRVHFLALEGTAPALRNRIGCLARGLGIDPDGDLLGENLFIDYKPRGANLSEAPYAAWYCQEVQRIEARLCLIDTVRRAARIRESGAGVEDLQVLGENLEPLRNDRSVLFAHHARKMQPANQGGTWTPPLERLSGSGDWGGLVEVGIVLDRRKGTEWRDTRLEIDGRDISSFAPMRVIYEGEGTGPEGMLSYADELTVRIEDADDDSNDEGAALSAEQVSVWLVDRPRVQAKTSEIAEHFGVSKKTVQRAQPALKRWGVSWTEPRQGMSQFYYLDSPAYAASRGTET